MPERFRKVLKPSPFKLFIILIFILGIILRFQMLQNFVLNGDSTRDILIAQTAIERHEFPPIGPFSSAGPFVVGPIYFWIIMAGLIIFPFGIMSAWILFFFLSVINLLIFILIGYFLGGKRLAVIVGLLAATSVSITNLSINVTNPVLILITTSLLILFFILFVQKKKNIFIFLAGLSLGLALGMHYQAVNLLIFFPSIFFIRGIGLKKKIISMIIFSFGTFIPLMPLLYWDSHQNFANIRNVLDYFLIAQYRIYVPNSWKIFIFKDMSYIWGNISGGHIIFGIVSMILIAFVSLLVILRKIKIKQEVVILAFIFLPLLILNRFYRGERSEIYLLYFFPFVLIFISISLNNLINKFKNKKLKYVVYLVLLTYLIGNLFTLRIIFNFQKNNISSFETPLNDLKNRYPNQKFSLYDKQSKNANSVYPLSLVFSSNGYQSEEGIKIALNCVPDKLCSEKDSVTHVSGIPIINIDSFSEEEIEKNYASMNKGAVYDSLIGWAKKHELKSSFSLRKFLFNR